MSLIDGGVAQLQNASKSHDTRATSATWWDSIVGEN
jgi:hypothetical protein